MSSKIAKNTVGLISLQFILKGIATLWTFYMARKLGVSQYGLWANILALVAIFGTVQGIGTANVIFKEVSQKNNDAPRYFGSSLLIFGISSFIIFFCILLLSLLLGYRGNKLILTGMAAFSIVAVAPGLACQSILYGLEQFVRYQIIFLLGSFIYFVLGFILLETGFSIGGVFVALSLGYCMMSLLLILTTRNQCGGSIIWKESKLLASSLVQLGWPLAVAAILTEITLRFDRILIDRFFGEAEVGIYQASFNLTIIPREALLIPFITALASKLYHYYANDKNAFMRLFEKSNIILWIGSLGIMGPCMVYPNKIIEFFYGKEFSRAASILPVLISGILPFFLLVLWQNVLIAQGKTKTLLWINFCSAIFSVLANTLCIKYLGITGAAWVTLISFSGALLLTFFILKDEKLFFSLKRIPIILMAFILTVSLSLAWYKGRDISLFQWMLAMGIQTFIYLLLLILFRAIQREELNWVIKQLRSFIPFAQTADKRLNERISGNDL